MTIANEEIRRNVEPLTAEMQLIREHVFQVEKFKPAATKEEPTLRPHSHYIRYGANELVRYVRYNSQSCYLKEDGMRDVYDIAKVEKIAWECFNRPLVLKRKSASH